ncbi:beta-ketoacyl-[acyl-carrier-protein] synthase family protein, partial [Candidatus Hydrogenedentota bacterium]
LESLEHAKTRNAGIFAEFAGYGASGDAYHPTAPAPEGRGAQIAMKLAMEQAEVGLEGIDYYNAHGTSTSLNDKLETQALKGVFGEKAYDLCISSTKSMTGHMLGAAGAAEFIACIMAIKNGVAPPTINQEVPDPECDLNYTPNTAVEKNIDTAMSASMGFGGHNAVVLVKKYVP